MFYDIPLRLSGGHHDQTADGGSLLHRQDTAPVKPTKSSQSFSHSEAEAPPEMCSAARSAARRGFAARLQWTFTGWWLTYPSEKYESIGIFIPNICKNKKCSKPPTRFRISEWGRECVNHLQQTLGMKIHFGSKWFHFWNAENGDICNVQWRKNQPISIPGHTWPKWYPSWELWEIRVNP